MFTVTIQGQSWPVDDAKLYGALLDVVIATPASEGAVTDLIWQLLHTIAFEPRHIVCRCGRSVLAENFPNHRKRKDGRPHSPAADVWQRT